MSEILRFAQNDIELLWLHQECDESFVDAPWCRGEPQRHTPQVPAAQKIGCVQMRRIVVTVWRALRRPSSSSSTARKLRVRRQVMTSLLM